MRQRIQAAGALAAVAAVVALGSTALAGQSGAPSNQKIPRTADGKPDLQGVWDFRTITPLQRPTNLADKEVLTAAEIAEFERANTRNQDTREVTQLGQSNGAPTNSDLERAYNDFWWDFGKNAVSTRRTSLIIDPPDGRMPALTPEAQARGKLRAGNYQRAAYGPEDRGVGERCILGFNSGPPMLPSAYNNNVQIFQTPTHVALLNEMVHNARIIPVNGPAHVKEAIRQWVGDSRGRWEGDTFIVETTNFSGETAFPNSSPSLKLIERFRRVSESTLLYEFTVNDPTTWTKAWTAQVPMEKSDERLYEYACHEGNYGMTNLLSAARAVDAGLVKQK
jgi:hypothetical protein